MAMVLVQQAPILIEGWSLFFEGSTLMYKVVVNVSGKRARIVPANHKLGTAERLFGELSQEDALANKDGLQGAVLSLLADRGITDGDLYTVELPDALVPAGVLANPLPDEADETKKASKEKGPVTKPENPKEGEQNSPQNKPETQNQEPATGKQPTETQPKPL